jgi:Flp pilus assembly pilin Flp
MTDSKTSTRLWSDERGSAAVGYIIVAAFAIAMAIAVLGLRLPIKRAEDAARPFLADDNP